MEVTRKQSLPNVPKKDIFYPLIRTRKWDFEILSLPYDRRTNIKNIYENPIYFRNIGNKIKGCIKRNFSLCHFLFLHSNNVYKCQPEFTMLQIFTEDSVIL